METRQKHHYCCSECGSENVQYKAWIDANTDEIVDDCEESAWCNDCENDVYLVDLDWKPEYRDYVKDGKVQMLPDIKYHGKHYPRVDVKVGDKTIHCSNEDLQDEIYSTDTEYCVPCDKEGVKIAQQIDFYIRPDLDNCYGYDLWKYVKDNIG